jgi:hypothetical protein
MTRVAGRPRRRAAASRPQLAGQRRTCPASADLVEGKCRAAFERYVGVAYDESDLDLDFWTADEEGWSSGVRTLVCFVYDPSHESTTEALAGTTR